MAELRRNLPANAIKQCSACGHNSVTYKGSFIRVPREENLRRLWLVRLGIVGDDEPLPIRVFFVCQDHFDMKKDFKHVAGGSLRLRSGTLPWRNLADGEQSYHGLDVLPKTTRSDPDCACRCCLKRKIRTTLRPSRTASSQTGDFDLCQPPPVRNLPKGAFACGFCRGTNGLKALFSGGTALFPPLLDQIYIVTGILLNATQNEDILICKACQQQIEQSWGFRLRAKACFSRNGTVIMTKQDPPKPETTPKPVTTAPNPLMNLPIPTRNVPKPVFLPKTTIQNVPIQINNSTIPVKIISKTKTPARIISKPIKLVKTPIQTPPKPKPTELEPEHFFFEVEPLDAPPEVKRIKLEPPGEEYEQVRVKSEPMEG